MHDIFYIGLKPNLFPHEQPAVDILDAARKTTTRFCWIVNSENDYVDFDFHWMPPKWEYHQTHVFGSQWQQNSGTYFVQHNTTELIKHYRTEQRVVHKSIIENWIVPKNIETNSFDFSWHPDPDEPPYVHIFGTKWWNVGGPTYHCAEAISPKFHDELRAKTIPIWHNWIIPDYIDKDSFDFSWCPHPDEPPYIYRFGTQWQRDGGPQYKEFMNNGKVKYVDEYKAKSISKMYNWYLDETADYSTFDFSWHPEESQKEYKHIFGTQWQNTSSTAYYSGADQWPAINFVNDVRVTSSSNALPRYFIDTTLDDLVAQHPNERFWALSKDLNYDEFDFSWHPDISQVDYLHVFGSQWQKHSETYLVNATPGKKRINYVSDIKSYNSANLDIFFIDKGNKDSDVRYDRLKAKYPQIQKTRFANNLQQTAKRCATKSKTERYWMLSSEFVYDDFDFSWSPEPWELSMTHIFGSKWNKWSDTILLSKFDLTRHSSWCKDISEWPNLNFVADQKIETDEQQAEIWYIEHHNPESTNTLATLKTKYPNIKVNRFVDNYLDAITRCINQSETSHVWIVSSICDYSEFDFGWYPDAWQHNMLHTFASNEQKYGDTFFVPVTEFKMQRPNITKLEDFNAVNYVSQYKIKRHDVETIIYREETLPDALKTHAFSSNYALFLPENYAGPVTQHTPNLWSGKDRNIHVLSEGAEFALIPKDVVRFFNEELYDYPFIDFSKKDTYQSKPLDIVFISNGESMADEMWEILNERILDGGYQNRVVRIDGINGRSAAYKAASGASQTPWSFNVFAKLEIDKNFDFNWQPDRLQKSKHYIFHAKNPVNRLEYGHQAVIAYNKNLVLNMDDNHGLDFTLSSPHEVIPMLSGTSHFNKDPLVTWRTSFRECIKLKYFADNNDLIAKERLAVWLTVAEGENAELCLKGANDAISYYESVSGELSELLKSFEWEWLNSYWLSLDNN